MKKFAFLLAFTIVFVTAQSAIINVDNNPDRPSGYYENLQLAINIAAVGDTLYVYPSNTTYGSIIIKKRLHLFGSGYDGISGGGDSKIHQLTLDTSTSPSTNPSGSSFQGFEIYYISCSKSNITNILISGNYISYSSGGVSLYNNCPGWFITNNIISGYISIYNNRSILVSNNIFKGGYSYANGISNSSSPSVIISHNLFLNWNYFNNVYNATICDNIFICKNVTSSTAMSNNNFLNNISWRSALTPYLLPPESNIGSGNISNQDPQFETALSSGNFDYSKDYHLKSTSPGINAATDGTNIGPYGGSIPFSFGGEYSIPKITLTNITNPVINQSTPINVNIKASKAKL